jgi:Tol biopolymer transport system component
VLTTEEPQTTTSVDPTLLIEEARARQRQRHGRRVVVLSAAVVVVTLAVWIAHWASGLGNGGVESTPPPVTRTGPSRLAVSLFRAPTRADIYTMNSRGGDFRRLTKGRGMEAFPAWSPNGTRIAFDWQRGAAASGLYVMNTDGTGRRLIAPAQWGVPAWSPDGTKIAFTGSKDDRINVVNSDGTAERLLARGSWPAWSPDGTKIAYTENTGDPSWIYVMNADGTDQHRLARGYFPAWSPDGKTIAFVEYEQPKGLARAWVHTEPVWIMNTDGSDKRPLHVRTWVDCQLQWSPGGQLAVSNPAGLFLVRLHEHAVTKLSGAPICGVSWQPVGS